MSSNRWHSISSHQSRKLSDLFAQDTDRVGKLTVKLGALHFDFSKTHLDDNLLTAFADVASKADFEGKRKALFDGAIVNVTEGRAAEHMAERGNGNAQSVAQAKGFHNRMRGLVEALEAGAFGEIHHILHIGIGGSALGPDMVLNAIDRGNHAYDVAVISNVDASDLEQVMEAFEPQHTLIAVASKTFTTTETLMNAQSALQWLKAGGVEDPYGRVVALTAAPEKAVEWGVDESRILPFSPTVGGRYSLWSSIGFPIAAALGWAGFEELLEGAALMDRHFKSAPLLENAPVLAAFADLYYTQARGCQTRALFAYDGRLSLLPDYLQQLEMESNGKSVTADGLPVDYATAPITWGGVGTDAQHAVFQLLHQGTHLIPVEFIVSKTPGHDLDPAHHETLLVNCFAQGAALMAGRHSDDPARSYAGDRPSTTILVDDITPSALGALIAFYEHRTFANAVLLGINPFDQFGVELGKEIAKDIAENGPAGFDPSTSALIAAAAT